VAIKPKNLYSTHGEILEIHSIESFNIQTKNLPRETHQRGTWSRVQSSSKKVKRRYEMYKKKRKVWVEYAKVMVDPPWFLKIKKRKISMHVFSFIHEVMNKYNKDALLLDHYQQFESQNHNVTLKIQASVGKK
jgi:hypothetical protein